MERSEKAKVGLYMMLASIFFIPVAFYMQFIETPLLFQFDFFIPYAIFAILMFDGADRFIKNKWGKNNSTLTEQTPAVQEPVEKTLEVQA